MLNWWILFVLIYVSQWHLARASVYVLRNVPFSVIVASFEDVVSRFGPELFHLDGFLAMAEPIHACERIRPRPSESTGSPSADKISSLPYIALVERGGCDFDLKVFNAQNANYSGVIVYNTVPNEIFPMSGQNYINDIFIPAVMVNKMAGDKLKMFAIAEGRKEFVVSLVSFYSLPLKYVLLSLLVLVGVSLIILVVCFAAHLCNLWRRMRRGRLSRRHLRRLQTKRFEKARDPYETCPICLEDYKERDKIRLLPCHHAFHTRCIDPWLLRNRRRCPVCNQTVELPGAPSSEDVVVTVHDPIQPPSLFTRIRRLRLLFAPQNAIRRERNEWNSSAESGLASVANGPAANEQDEERAPLLEQRQSPQASRYSANLAYSAHLVTSDETLEQPPLLDLAANPEPSSSQIPEDDELIRLHKDESTPSGKMEVPVPLPVEVAMIADISHPTDQENPHIPEDDQLLSDVGKVAATSK